MNTPTAEQLAALCIFPAPTAQSPHNYTDESDYSNGEVRQGDLHTLLLIRANRG